MLSRHHRRLLSKKHRVFSSYIRYNDVSDSSGQSTHNPCEINDAALLDLKTRGDAITHARRCEACNCPLYRDELLCPICGHKRVFFGMS